MSSWKCGKNVAAYFCRLDYGVDCNKIGYGESAAGYSESQSTGLDNKLSHLVVFPYDPDNLRAITVFAETECHGHSAVLWSDMKYQDTENQLYTGNEIKSVMFPKGDGWWASLYTRTRFRKPIIINDTSQV